MTNPYNAPQNLSQQPNEPYGRDPLANLKGPGISLIAVSALSLLNVLAGPFINVMMGTLVAGTPEFIGQVAAAIVLASIHAFVLVSGKLMLDGKRHGVCMAGAIIACIPICTPCIVLGIPFGIWAIVVLQQPAVKRAFR